LLHVLIVIAAYLLGSIPFSYLVARRFGVEDVRTVGSGNVGASNVMRSVGVPAGVLAFLLDALKGGVASLVAERLAPGTSLAALAAGAAVLGHMFPVWLGLRGGKGVATGAGAFLPLAPVATGIALGVFVTTLATTRYVSVSSMAGALSLPLAAFALDLRMSVVWASAAVAVIIVVAHFGNLARLARGHEPRLGAPRP
jgi:glycerol-3-phosphate acyltransferase PlsY